MPHTVFDTPVKLFIPCPGFADVSNISLYYYNGLEWREAINSNGEVLPGGVGWAVPDSRVNHNESDPPLIEVQVYHFSAAQAAAIVFNSGSAGGTAGFAAGSSSGGGGGACFIGSVSENISLPGYFGLSSFLSLVFLFALIRIQTLLRGVRRKR